MRLNFELSELQAFVAVAESLNFRAAAEALFISQSALSRRVDKIEDALGIRLFERTTRRVSLTEDGEHFLVCARDALLTLEDAVGSLGDRNARRAALLTVACIPSVANHLLPAALAEFAESYPAIRVRVIGDSAPIVTKAVVDGDAEFGINFIGAQEPSIDYKAIMQEKYQLAVRSDHPLAARAQVSWAEFSGERFIALSSVSGNRMLIDNAVTQARLRPPIHYEVNHVDGALALVNAGLGVAAIPSLALKGLLTRGIVGVPLVKPAVHRTLGLISRKGHRPGNPTRLLMRLLTRALRKA